MTHPGKESISIYLYGTLWPQNICFSNSPLVISFHFPLKWILSHLYEYGKTSSPKTT